LPAVLDPPPVGTKRAKPVGRGDCGCGLARRPRTRAAIVCRAAVHIDLAAARLGCAPCDYLTLYPHLRSSVARRAIADVRDALSGLFPANGLTDGEALQEARLWRAAWMQPLNEQGNRTAEALRLAAARLRARGTARLRERAMPMLQAAE
jgi:hypothetical protein